MIEVSAANAFLLYLAITLGTLFSLWAYQHFYAVRKTILSSSEKLYLCEYCHFLYMDKAEREVTRCPECKSYNKNNDYKDP